MLGRGGDLLVGRFPILDFRCFLKILHILKRFLGDFNEFFSCFFHVEFQLFLGVIWKGTKRGGGGNLELW